MTRIALLICLLAATGCTTLRFSDGTRATRIGWGSEIEYHRQLQTPAGIVVEGWHIGGNVDPLDPSEIIRQAIEGQRPPPL